MPLRSRVARSGWDQLVGEKLGSFLAGVMSGRRTGCWMEGNSKRNDIRVRANLVALGSSALHQPLAFRLENIAPVGAVDKERSRNTVVPESVQNLSRVDIRPVVKGQSNGARNGAPANDLPNRHRGDRS